MSISCSIEYSNPKKILCVMNLVHWQVIRLENFGNYLHSNFSCTDRLESKIEKSLKIKWKLDNTKSYRICQISVKINVNTPNLINLFIVLNVRLSYKYIVTIIELQQKSKYVDFDCKLFHKSDYVNSLINCSAKL